MAQNEISPVEQALYQTLQKSWEAVQALQDLNTTVQTAQEQVSEGAEGVQPTDALNGQLSVEAIQAFAEQIEQNNPYFTTRVALDAHEPTRQPVIEILDKETQNVLKTIPAVELLDLAAMLESWGSMVFNIQVPAEGE